jgi:RHS repeat-associated protein
MREATVGCSTVTGPESLSAPLRDFKYSYDGYGNRSQLNERGSFEVQSFAEEQTYAFDERDRLTAVAYADRADVYRYDGNGNRRAEMSYSPVSMWKAADYVAPESGVTPQGSKELRYNNRDQLTDVLDALRGNAELSHYVFDDAEHTVSRRVSGGTTTYGWGADETLRWARDSGGNELAGFQYEGGRLRRRKVSSAPGEGDRVYVYDGGSLVAELDAATGAPKLEYIYGTELLGVIDYSQSQPQVQWIHRDGMRSVVERTANLGNGATRVAGPFRYDAFGGYRTTPEAVQPGADGQSKVGYTGHVFDVETGLVYAKARYYQPEMGQFLSQDALEGQMDSAPSLNRYAYALGNPYRYWDPTGNEDEKVEEKKAQGKPKEKQRPGYTKAQGARMKQKIDDEIRADGVEVDRDSGDYWKEYIGRKSKRTGKETHVKESKSGLQVFLIKDGYEGFMQEGKKTNKYIDWIYPEGQEKPKPYEVQDDLDFENGDSVMMYNIPQGIYRARPKGISGWYYQRARLSKNAR